MTKWGQDVGGGAWSKNEGFRVTYFLLEYNVKLSF